MPQAGVSLNPLSSYGSFSRVALPPSILKTERSCAFLLQTSDSKDGCLYQIVRMPAGWAYGRSSMLWSAAKRFYSMIRKRTRASLILALFWTWGNVTPSLLPLVCSVNLSGWFVVKYSMFEMYPKQTHIELMKRISHWCSSCCMLVKGKLGNLKSILRIIRITVR